MKMNVYAVFDKAVEAFLPPFFARADGEASRMFVNALADTRSELSGKTLDLTLFRLGCFDDVTGVLEPIDAPLRLLSGLNAVGKLQKMSDDVEKAKGAN